jgi:potassium uptake TrkH family protein
MNGIKSVYGARIDRFRVWMVSLAGLLAVVSFIVEYGFYLSERQQYYVHLTDIVIVGMFLLDTLLALLFAPKLKKAFLRALPLIVIAAVFGIQLLVVRFMFSGRPAARELMEFLRISSLTKIYFLILQVYILFNLVFYTEKLTRRIAYTRFRPAQLLVAAFLLLILAGSLLLMLPRATPAGKPLSYVDALFTATSAVCVTGLVVVDTATGFTRMGQFVIMMLIQIGGLGIMTFAAFFAMLLGKGLSIRERVVFGEVMHVEFMRHISRLVVSIILVTFLIEAVGSVLFFYLFPADGAGVFSRLFTSVFHSISGFCNAGFSVFTDGFMSFARAVPANLVMMLLIVLGGLGFTVHQDLFAAFTNRMKRRKRPYKFRLQTKIVLLASGLLVFGGAVVVYVLERGNVSALQALFQSVTARTAGFNTVSQAALREETQLFTIFLMFIGAAPGSTAGGIKITTLVVLVATIAAMLRGRSRTELSRKTIPEDTVREAIVILGLSLFAVAVAFMLLLISESAPFTSLVFETVSAFGTVGLSLGVTPHLSIVGKIIITFVMFFGRLGPMTMALAVSGKLRERGYTYPKEKIMVG